MIWGKPCPLNHLDVDRVVDSFQHVMQVTGLRSKYYNFNELDYDIILGSKPVRYLIIDIRLSVLGSLSLYKIIMNGHCIYLLSVMALTHLDHVVR